jgi:hypothetical protein
MGEFAGRDDAAIVNVSDDAVASKRAVPMV